MSRMKGFIGGVFLWAIPVAFWWRAMTMDTVIMRYGEPISPFISQVIGVFFVGMGLWGGYTAYGNRKDYEDELAQFYVVILLIMLWCGACGSAAFVIADKQAELMTLAELR